MSEMRAPVLVPPLEQAQPEHASGPRRDSFPTLIEEHGHRGDPPWLIESANDLQRHWIRARHPDARPPDQGWKLHLSATPGTAQDVLHRALPILMGEPISFKTAPSLSALASLNSGEGGPSQVGKFITIYPNDDQQAVRLATALDRATRGLSGPAIPSDRPLTPGSLVHYRYGGFAGLWLQTAIGEVVPAIVDPSGSLVPDHRPSAYAPPTWATDPFMAAGVSEEPEPPPALIAGRYIIAATLHRSPRGAVYLALDIDHTRRCVLKHARRDTAIGPDGKDARARVRYEAEVLARLAPDPRFPAPYDLVEAAGDVYLAMEDVQGSTLEHEVERLTARGQMMPPGRVISWGRRIAAAAGRVHAAGLIHRDLKSSNLIVAPDGLIRLLDFELALPPGHSGDRSGAGTRGYMSPQQAAGEPPRITDDVYSLGALLYFIASGAEPSMAPNPFALLDRPLALLNPPIGPALTALIARCLNHDPIHRFPSMAAVDLALAAVSEPAGRPLGWGAWAATGEAAAANERYGRLAQRLGDSLCHEAQPVGDDGLAWISRHAGSAGLFSRDLNIGGAGAVLALAELVLRRDNPEHGKALASGARWLAGAPAPGGAPLPGLYVGEAGIGAALLRAGQALGDRALIALAEERGRRVACLPFASPDLFNGTAGRLRFHLLLWDETGEREHLTAALAAGEALVAAARTPDGAEDDRERCWIIPEGYERMTGDVYLGYAHGAAGIADALLDLFDVTTDRRYLDVAAGAGRWLARQAIVADPGENPALAGSLNWPITDGMPAAAPMWCHGAAGIGRFFLHAARSGAMPGAWAEAEAAGRAAARCVSWASPVQCHGLSGNIEFLLDLYQATDDPAYLGEARMLAALLEASAIEREGRLFWASESPDVLSPDYLVGYAGVAVCLLRLADPAHAPHQLSREGFRYGMVG